MLLLFRRGSSNVDMANALLNIEVIEKSMQVASKGYLLGGSYVTESRWFSPTDTRCSEIDRVREHTNFDRE